MRQRPGPVRAPLSVLNHAAVILTGPLPPAGSASLNARMNGKIAMRTVVYFVLTSLLNAVLGILLVVAIHPGDPTMRNAIEQSDQSRRATIMDGLLDLGRCVLGRPGHHRRYRRDCVHSD